VPHVFTYQVAPDGQRFLVNTYSGAKVSPSLTLITDWTALLRQ
jgi:hypothetical protein